MLVPQSFTRFCCCLLLVAGLTNTATAQVKKFPYDAKIVVDRALVHSGGGENFYATQELSQGDVVKVLRHDPGGWYMIAPPKGSFSWIRKRFVTRTTPGIGEVSGNDSVVFVGSQFGDEITVWQRKLAAGDQVEILEERTVDSLAGPQEMYKIAPPTREYRWIRGASVVPVDASVRDQHDSDPWRVPSNITGNQRQQHITSPERESPPASAGPIQPSRQLAKLQQIRREQKQLKEIDSRFRSMVLGAPSAWDLDSLEADYRQLQESATWRPLSGQIDLRFPAIERYRQRKAEIEDFNRLTSQTEKRDAELLASQFSANTNIQTASVPPTTIPADGFLDVESMFPESATPATTFGTTASTFESSATPFQESPSPTFNIPANSRYIGAGILKKSVGDDGQSHYELASPSGRTLARVEAKDSTVDLESHVGQSIGLHGSRWFKDDIKSDYIEVSGLEQVRLK